MDDEIVDLGRGALLITDLDPVDLSNLSTVIAQAELSGVETLEIDTTK